MFKILVVDDNKPTQLLMQAVLEAENYTVFTASDGIEALGIMDDHHIDLVLADDTKVFLSVFFVVKEKIQL